MSRPSWNVPSGPRSYCALDADRPEADGLVGGDGPRVGRRRVDGQPMVAALVEQPARGRPDGVTTEAAALEVRPEEQVEPGVPVVRVVLLAGLHAARDLRRRPRWSTASSRGRWPASRRRRRRRRAGRPTSARRTGRAGSPGGAATSSSRTGRRTTALAAQDRRAHSGLEARAQEGRAVRRRRCGTTTRRPSSGQVVARTVAPRSAARAYSRRIRRGSARVAATPSSPPATHDLLVEPVGVDRVVDVVERVELLGPDRDPPRDDVGRRVAEVDPGRAGRSPSATPKRRLDLGRDALRHAPPVDEHPVDVDPRRRGAVGVGELGPPPGPHPPEADDLGRAGDRRAAAHRAERRPARRRARARSRPDRRTRPGRSPARPSAARPGPGRSAAAPTSAPGRPGRPRRSGPGTAPGSRRSPARSLGARQPIERLEGDERRSRSCGAVWRSRRTRHERSASNTTSPTRSVSPSSSAWVRASSSWWRTSAEMPRAPHLQSQASAAPSRSTVTSYGWISARTPSNRTRRSRRTAAAPTRRARSVAVSASTIAPRSWSRTWSPRSAISRATARMASDADRSSGGDGRPEQRREHRHPRRRGRSLIAVHRGAGQHALGRRRVGQQRRRRGRRPGRPGCPRRRRRGRRGRRPGTSRRLAQGEQHDLRVRRQPVDGSMRILDRAGSRRRPSRARSRRPGRAARRRGRPRPRRGGHARRAVRSCDVRPLVLDVLAELGQLVVRVEGGDRGRRPGSRVGIAPSLRPRGPSRGGRAG